LRDERPEATDGNISTVSAIVCDRSVTLLQDYEAQNLWKLDISVPEALNEDEFVRFYLGRVKSFDPFSAEYLSNRIETFSYSILPGVPIPQAYSSEVAPTQIPAGCTLKTVIYELERKIKDDPRFLVDENLWNNFLTPDQKARALIQLGVLDRFYSAKAQNSNVRSRYVSAYIASNIASQKAAFYEFWGRMGEAGRIFFTGSGGKFIDQTINGTTKLVYDDYNPVSVTFQGITITLNRGDYIEYDNQQFKFRTTGRTLLLKPIGKKQSILFNMNDQNVSSGSSSTPSKFIDSLVVVTADRVSLTTNYSLSSSNISVKIPEQFVEPAYRAMDSAKNFRKNTFYPVSTGAEINMRWNKEVSKEAYLWNAEFNEDGNVESARLGRSLAYQDGQFPTGSKVIFLPDGTIQSVEIPQSSSASVFVSNASTMPSFSGKVLFHPNGKIKQGKITNGVEIGAIAYGALMLLTFDENGAVIAAEADTNGSPVWFKAISQYVSASGLVQYYPNGNVQNIVLKAEATIYGHKFPATSRLSFREDGSLALALLDDKTATIRSDLPNLSTIGFTGVLRFFENNKIAFGATSTTITYFGNGIPQGTGLNFDQEGIITQANPLQGRNITLQINAKSIRAAGDVTFHPTGVAEKFVTLNSETIYDAYIPMGASITLKSNGTLDWVETGSRFVMVTVKGQRIAIEKRVEFHESGAPKSGTLVLPYTIDGTKYEPGTVLTFDELGNVLSASQ
jgi:hypothetical protein